MYEHMHTQTHTHHFAVASYQGCPPLSSQCRNLLCMKWTSRNLSFSWKSPGIRRTSLRLAAFEFSGREHPASCPGRISRRKEFLPSSRCPPLNYPLANNWTRVSAELLICYYHKVGHGTVLYPSTITKHISICFETYLLISIERYEVSYLSFTP